MVKQDSRMFSENQEGSVNKSGLDTDTTFFVDNYGGINKTAPPNNLPYADSPDMRNIRVSLAGVLSKRGGSFIRANETTQPIGTICTTYTLDSGLVLLIAKLGTSISVYLLPSKESKKAATLVNTFENVWASSAEFDRPSFVWTSEDRPRLIMVSKNSVPIDLEIFRLAMPGNGSDTIQVIGDYTEIVNSDFSWGIYEDTVVNVTSLSESAGNTTFTFDTVIPSGQVIELVCINWHWWAESIKRNNDQLYGTNFRFNTSVTADANVEINTELRRGLEADSQIFRDVLDYGRKMMKVYTVNTAAGTEFTFDITPTTNLQYAFSNRVFTSGTDSITPGTAYLTFGGIVGSGTSAPTPVHMVREIYLPFNGGTGSNAEHIEVVDNTGFNLEANFSTTILENTSDDKYYFLLDESLNIQETPTNQVKAIRFNGGYPYGISEQFVEISNSEPNPSYVGSNASSTYYSPIVLGSYRPWYGASLYANYLSGVFPTVVGLYQDRLVLSGFLSAPLTLLLSNSKDNGSRFYYQNFQVDYEDTTISTNPIEVILDGYTDDKVTNVASWFDSMFVLTKKSTRRIHGGDALAITPTSLFQNTVSSVGCQSTHGVARTDSYIVFISNSGLYQIEIANNGSDYMTTNIGLKVEDFFIENSNNPEESWIFYNQLDDEVWIGLSSDDDNFIPNRCLVYFNKRGSWSEYSLSSGYLPTIFGCTDTFRSFAAVVLRDDTQFDEEPGESSQVLFCEFNLDGVFTDLTYKETSTNLEAGSVTKTFHTKVEYTINSSQTILNLSPRNIPSSNHGFRLIPINDLSNNIRVRYYDGIEWTNKQLLEDYTLITNSNSIRYINFPYTDGHLLEVTLVNDSGTYPIHIIRDNYELPVTDYTIDESGDFVRVTLNSTGDSTAEYLVGQTILCYHVTPSFFRRAVSNLKRVSHYVGYYSNKGYLETNDSNSDPFVIDKYVVPVSVNFGIIYNDRRTGVYESEIYGSEELNWDLSSFDVLSDAFRNQESDIVRIVVPVVGVGYSFQTINYNFSLDRFQLVGYQVLTRMKGRRSLYGY